MGFIEYIESQGFKKMVMSTKTFKLEEPSEYAILSTMGYLDFRYVKGEKVITWGLNEHGKPPTLISPLPYKLMELKDNEYYGQNAPMDRVLQKYSPEEILKELYGIQ